MREAARLLGPTGSGLVRASRLHELLGGGSCEKLYTSGTHRLCEPSRTIERVAPHLRSMGITRVADITGLDRIGIPVVMVSRPNSRSLAVSQGKGLTLDSARASAIMESIETFHAERVSRPLRLSDRRALAEESRVIDTRRMARSRDSPFDDEWRLLWTTGIDLIGGETVWIPYESVHTDFTLPRPTGSGCFPANTNGLASGNSRAEAVAHALCEVIERDALALWHLRGSPEMQVLDIDSVGDADFQGLVSRLHDADLDLRIWNATSDVGIACFNCLIVGRDGSDTDPEFGSGCHPDSRVALLRAVTEAVQARTTFIAGSRDDFGFAAYSASARAGRHKGCRALLSGEAEYVVFDSIDSHSFDTVLKDIAWATARLISVGIEEAVWVDLTSERYRIPVVRVVVPGLEGAYKGESGDFAPGARARELMGA